MKFGNANFGNHDLLNLSPEEAEKLSADFWRVFLESGYPDGYMRAVIQESYDSFRADFTQASEALVAGAGAYLGAEATGTRPCPCQECKENQKEGAP